MKSHLLLLIALLLFVAACRSTPKPAEPTGSWKTLSSDKEDAFFEINFITPTEGWIAGWSEKGPQQTNGWEVLHTSDGGQNMDLIKDQAKQKIRYAYFVNQSTGWAIRIDGSIMKTGDGGTGWTLQRKAGKVEVRNEAYTKSPIMKEPEPIERIFFIDQNVGWAWGGGRKERGYSQLGVLLLTSNGGANWKQVDYPFEQDIVTLQFINAQNGWAYVKASGLYATSDGGRNWNKLDIGSPLPAVSSIFFLDPQNGWIVGRYGYLARTTDGGRSWEKQKSNTDAYLRDVFFVSPTKGWIVGDRGLILFTNDGGRNWVKQESGTEHDLTGLQFLDEKTGWAIGNNGVLLQFVAPG